MGQYNDWEWTYGSKGEGDYTPGSKKTCFQPNIVLCVSSAFQSGNAVSDGSVSSHVNLQTIE